jgi:uncharacterized protein
MSDSSSPPHKRLGVYLAATFAITWVCWWTLTRQVHAGESIFGSGLTTTLYILGGFGPTLGAYIAVATTPREGALSEYNSRLFRWRVNPVWYVVVFALPPVVALGKEWIAGLVAAPPGGIYTPVQPLADVLTLFPTMIIGGGLEELGWRGVAQPSLERRIPRLVAALVIGVIWGLWHLPLFYLHGVSQFGGNFPLFLVDVVANAFFLALIYGGTRSILLCVLFHAAGNTAASMGLFVPDGSLEAAWVAAAAKLLLAFVLLVALSPRLSAAGKPILH